MKSKIIKIILIPFSLGILSASVVAPIVMSSCGEQTSKQSDEQDSEQTSIPVTGVKLDDSELKLAKDETKQLTATISPNDASNKKVK